MEINISITSPGKSSEYKKGIVEKFNFDAKKAYEYAAGEREIITDKRTRKIRRYTSCKKTIELTDEEQKIFETNYEYAYKYSVKLMKKRFCETVENNILNNASNNHQIKYVIRYCNYFNIAIPVNLHNKILLESAFHKDNKELSYSQRIIIKREEKTRQKYLKKFQEQKKDFILILNGIIRDNKLDIEHTTLSKLLELLH